MNSMAYHTVYDLSLSQGCAPRAGHLCHKTQLHLVLLQCSFIGFTGMHENRSNIIFFQKGTLQSVCISACGIRASLCRV
jgi:hypothetical protein